MEPVIVVIILVALTFDFLNGFHDAANSIATVVSTRVLSPQKAVLWAAFFNFVAAFGFVIAASLFAGDLTLRQYAGHGLFPMAAPTGGTLLIASWLALAVAAAWPKRG